jgi:hypothetical protein
MQKTFESDEPYKALIGKGINSRDYTWHLGCYEPQEAKRLGVAKEVGFPLQEIR